MPMIQFGNRKQFLEWLFSTMESVIKTEDIITIYQDGVYLDGYPAIPKGKSVHDSTARRMLTRDVKEINNDPEARVIIISDSKGGFKRATTQEELMRFIASAKGEAFNKLKWCNTVAKKAGLEGQIDLEGETMRVFGEIRR